jgi:hypothetical protein
VAQEADSFQSARRHLRSTMFSQSTKVSDLRNAATRVLKRVF